MGARGPVPKRDDQRRRQNKKKTSKAPRGATKPSAGTAAMTPIETKPLAEMKSAELDGLALQLEIPNWNKRLAVAKKRERVEQHVASQSDEHGIPIEDENWHPAAKRLYAALGQSGQSAFYEASDWAWAWIVAESISRDLKPQVVGIVEETGEVVRAVIPMKGASLAAYLKAMTALLATEGDRRRAGLELDRAAAGGEADLPADVAHLDDYRTRFAG